MKTYYRNPFSSNKNKVIIKVLIIAVCCITAFALTVILGNHLLKKAEESAQNGVGGHVEPTTTENRTDSNVSEYLPKLDTEPVKLRHNSAFVNLIAAENGEDTFAQIDDAYSRGCDAITVMIRDSGGTLYYASESMTRIFGIKFDAALPDIKRIAEVVNYAKQKMMTVSALFETCGVLDDREVAVYDELIVTELSSTGVDEIILTGVFNDANISSADVEKFLGYLTRLRKNARHTWFGVVTNSESYSTAVLAPLIENIAKYTDILLVDLRPKLADPDSDRPAAVSEFHNTLTGSITRYNLRVVTDIVKNDAELNTAFNEYALKNRTEIPYTLNLPDGD